MVVLRFIGWVLAAGLLALAGCSGTARLDSANAGRTTTYESGVPNFDMEAIATQREGEPGLDVYLGIPPISLVFVQEGSGYVATFETLIRLRDRRGKGLVQETATSDTVRVADYAATQDFRPLIRQQRVAASPGVYVVEVELIDEESEATAERQQLVRVGGEEALPGEPALSRIRLEGRREEAPFEPIVSLHVPAGIDSLRSIVELYGLRGDIEVAMTLLRFESDTTIAAAPYWLSASYGSLQHRGLRYDRADTLQVSRRQVADVGEEALVEFALPPLEEGVYRLAVEAKASRASGEPSATGGQAVRLEQVRDVSVKGSAFPRISTMEEMVEALTYIAYPREIEHIREARTSGEAKRRFDAFWGELLASRQIAANLIKLYYSRAEEANLYFTSFKEGWKTDRGMVYMVLGPPGYVDQELEGEVWYYDSYAGRDPLRTFTFQHVRPLQGDEAFENYVLERRPYYEQTWFRALDRWRDGTVL